MSFIMTEVCCWVSEVSFIFDGIAHGIAHLYIVDSNLSWRSNSPFVDVIIEDKCSKKKNVFRV